MSTVKRPRTPAQQEASRKNGQNSRGPGTDIGKQRSRMNALQHGLCAQSVVLPDEDESECQLLIDEYKQHYRPATTLEQARVRDMALCDWRLRRLTEIERDLLSLALLDAEESQQRHYRDLDLGEVQAYAFRRDLAPYPGLALLLRYQAQLQRSQERARKALQQLQAERKQQEAEDRALAPNEPERTAQPNEPKPTTHRNEPKPAAPPNEPKPVTPISPAPAISPNEPEPSTPSTSRPAQPQLPNEPKPATPNRDNNPNRSTE